MLEASLAKDRKTLHKSQNLIKKLKIKLKFPSPDVYLRKRKSQK